MPVRSFLISLFILLANAHHGQAPWNHGRLMVSPDKHAFQFQDGRPFFWLGDTGWQMFGRLSLEEIKTYLDNRVAKGFNVIQATILCEDPRKPNWYGHTPFLQVGSLKPDLQYFRLIESTLQLARERGIFMALMVTWAERVGQPALDSSAIFDSLNAYRFGYWLADRYKRFPNIIWILGGDRAPKNDNYDYIPVWRQMARGLQEGGQHRSLITYHPAGESSSSQWLHNESWLDFNMIQSSHGRRDAPNWTMISSDRQKTPAKPVLDAEPNYEDHPVNPWPVWHVENGYFRDYDVRKQIYRGVFAGGAGITYGHHAVWQFANEKEEIINYADRGWKNALDRPGAYQAGYLRRLIESRPIKERIPDDSIIAAGQGQTNAAHASAFRSVDNRYCMIYLPQGHAIALDLHFMTTRDIHATWYDLAAGAFLKTLTLKKLNSMSFSPPPSIQIKDWVLVIDAVEK